MVSIPCIYSSTALPPPLPHFLKSHLPIFFPRTPLHKLRTVPKPINAAGDNTSGAGPLDRRSAPRTLFPGGFRRPEIKIPSLLLRISSEEVLRREDAGVPLREALERGVAIVVMDIGEKSGGEGYEAACRLKSLVGDRAYIVIAERVDVAAAAGVSGVVLSDQGIPAIVARNMLSKSKSDAVFLPLVARDVHDAVSAENAAISDGADFIIISAKTQNWKVVLEDTLVRHIMVPVFFSVEFPGDSAATELASKFESESFGLVVSLDDLKLLSDDFLEKVFRTKNGSVRLSRSGYSDSGRVNINSFTSSLDSGNGIAGFAKLNDKEMKLLEVESHLLQEAVTVISKAAPMMNDVTLLMDSASRLKEPFLMVIVGEFNSGKSTVINALLGRKYLKEGVVPTTNEITLLCYSKKESNKLEHCERKPDGHFVCYLSAPILKNMNLVDTPGTNVILQRQQRLTEEFVPRADLILFIISSDRPLTESEVAFLRYVQQWKKKVVFVLNKLDLYQNTSELEEATTFVKENTRKLLSTGDVRLYPVSARSALEAKLYALSFDTQKYEELLSNDSRWMSSKFHELEKFLFSFLDGSTDTGMERMKIKLETPVAIAECLLKSSERLVLQQQENACQHLISIQEVVNSIEAYAMKLENESESWKKRAVSLIGTAEAQVVKLMEFTLQLSNIDLIATYAFKEENPSSKPTSTLQNEIINPALFDVQRLLGEYTEWLHSSISSEQELYTERLQKQCNKDSDLGDSMQSNTANLLEQGGELSIKVMESFSANAATRLFELEIREVVLGSFGGLGAAGLSASLLTSILPTTVEDLLALAFCSAGGFLVISKFPSRRKEAIKKVRKVASGLARAVEEAMQEDLRRAIDVLNDSVKLISKPYQDAAQQRIDWLLETREQLESTAQKLQDLKVEIQNLHVH